MSENILHIPSLALNLNFTSNDQTLMNDRNDCFKDQENSTSRSNHHSVSTKNKNITDRTGLTLRDITNCSTLRDFDEEL